MNHGVRCAGVLFGGSPGERGSLRHWWVVCSLLASYSCCTPDYDDWGSGIPGRLAASPFVPPNSNGIPAGVRAEAAHSTLGLFF